MEPKSTLADIMTRLLKRAGYPVRLSSIMRDGQAKACVVTIKNGQALEATANSEYLALRGLMIKLGWDFGAIRHI